SRSNRINFAAHDHCLSDFACFAKGIDLRIAIRQSIYQLLQFLVEEVRNQLRSMLCWSSAFVGELQPVAMLNPLRDHEAINAVGGQVFHVTVEQAGAFPVQDAIAITNHGANCRPRTAKRSLPDPSRLGTQVRIPLTNRLVRFDLVRKWELIDGDLVLVRMS